MEAKHMWLETFWAVLLAGVAIAGFRWLWSLVFRDDEYP